MTDRHKGRAWFQQQLLQWFAQLPAKRRKLGADLAFLRLLTKGSCTSWLRVIRLIQESGKMAPHYTMMRGHCHDSAPRVLPTGRHRIPLVMYHAALCLAEPRCGVPSAANGTRTHQV